MVENITEYKTELMKEYLKYSVKKSRRTTFICSGVIMLCALLEFLFQEYIMGAIFVLVGAFFITMACLMVPISMKKVTAMPKIKNEYQFYPDKMVITTYSKNENLGSSTIPYVAIFKVVENNNALYIYLNKVQALVVDNATFKENSDKEVVKAYIRNTKDLAGMIRENKVKSK